MSINVLHRYHVYISCAHNSFVFLGVHYEDFVMTVLFDESYIEYGRKKAEKDYEWLKKKFKATYPDNGEALLDSMIELTVQNIISDSPPSPGSCQLSEASGDDARIKEGKGAQDQTETADHAPETGTGKDLSTS